MGHLMGTLPGHVQVGEDPQTDREYFKGIIFVLRPWNALGSTRMSLRSWLVVWVSLLDLLPTILDTNIIGGWILIEHYYLEL